jgi:hypothetical protein
MLQLIDTEHSITEKEFHIFESKFINKIPESFKNHYLRDNGGATSEADREADSWGLRIESFFSIKFGDVPIEETVESFGDLILDDPKQSSEFGMWKKYEFIPFAFSYGGTIFISLRDIDYGFIYMCYPDPPSVGYLFPSFDVLIKEFYMIE